VTDGAPSSYVFGVQLLFVCSDNQCRSPLAERLTALQARRVLGRAAAEHIHAGSAGLEADAGRPMDARSARALTDLGGDPAGFRSRRFVTGMAEDADLVLTMTRRQRTIVLEHAPRALRRTYTLAEAADLIGQIDVKGLDELPLPMRARELAGRLSTGRARRHTQESDDVQDPVGRRARVHKDVAHRIQTQLRPLIQVLFENGRGTALPGVGQQAAAG
jgi:protein-tyrosine phosphatase